MAFTRRAAEIWRAFTTDGVPGSGAHTPDKGHIRQWGLEVESLLQSAGTIGGAIFATKAQIDAALGYAADAQGWVYADSTAANNGIYRKSGASGAGSWTRVADLPFAILPLTVSGGTANAIQATTPLPMPQADLGAILLLTPSADNTGAVTLAVNGATAAALTGQGGEAMAAGYLKAGSVLALVKLGGSFRTLLDFRVVALSTQAAADAVTATAASASASASASSAATSSTSAAASAASAAASADASGSVNFYDTKAAADAALSGLSDGQIVEVLEDESRSGARTRYRKQSGVYVYKMTLPTVLPERVNVARYGTVGDGVADDTTALQAALTAGAGQAVYFPPGAYLITAALTIAAATTVLADPGTVTITQTTNNANALTLNGDDVTVDGLKLVGPNTGTGSAVRADSRNRPTIKNCAVQNWRFGVQLRGCKNFRVTSNTLWGGAYDSSTSADILIYGSSGAASSRGLISDNLCLSNNDGGISVDTNNGDKDVVVTGNVVWPLQSDGLTPLADGDNRRRYGIVAGYNGTTATRAVISANLVRDVPYAGIYAAAAALPAGDLSITGNVVARCGFGTLYPSDASLRAGIWCNGGADTITGNTVVDCTSAGIKVAPGYTYSSTDQPRAVIGNNSVARTAGYGIWLTIKPHGYLVSANRVFNSTSHNIYFETTTADGGNCHFVGNHVDSNGATTAGIAVSNSMGGYPCSVTGNRISGADNTTNDQFNSGVWFQGKVHVTSNVISKFHRGVTNGASVGRELAIKCGGNAFHDCAIGVSGGGAGPWIVDANAYDNVTTWLSGSAWQGTIYRASSTQGFGGGPVVHLADTSAPTAGTWAVGDYCAKTNPAVGQPKGWFCTTAGAPGTWTSVGNL